MITGIVTGDIEAVVDLIVYGPSGQQQRIQAIIDTRFNGQLTLPSTIITALRLVWRRCSQAILADGSTTVFDIYDAAVIWEGQRRKIIVDNAEADPLVGMGLLEGYELAIQVRPGGTVTVTKL